MNLTKINIVEINKDNGNFNVAYQMFNDSDFNDTYISFTGKETCLPLHSFGPSVRPTYLIHYICSGKGTFIYNGKEYNLSKGNAFLIEPNIMTYYQADKDEPWTYIWFGLKGNNIKRFFERMGLNKNNPIASFNDISIIENIFEKVLKTGSGGIKEEFTRQALLYEFLSCMSSETSVHINITRSDEFIKSNYVLSAIEFIQNNFFNNIKVHDVAAHIGISRNYLFTLFKEAMGHSPKEYIAHFKLSRACNMLDDSSLSIDAVSVYCGFENSATFSKAFKKQFNLSPSKYKKLKAERTDLSYAEFMRYLKKLK